MAERVLPSSGDYLTDGTRLVQVVGVNDAGEYAVEDCMTDGLETISSEELEKAWRIVPPER